MSQLSNILKTIFFALVLLQFAPSLIQSIRKQYGALFETHTKVGLLKIKNQINSSSYYTKHLNDFFKNPDIKAILLLIDSPGGAAGTGQAIFNEIKLLQKQHPKPIVTLTENTLASAAYNVAAATDWIISTPSALIGSIGDYLSQIKLKEFVEQWKIYVNKVSAGAYKNVSDPFSDITPEGQLLLQGIADEAYVQFTKEIATSRKLSLSKINDWANGKIFTGSQALKIGLVDELGSWTTAIERLREKALIEGEIEWVKPAPKTWVSSLFEISDDEGPENSTLLSQFAHALVSAAKKSVIA